MARLIDYPAPVRALDGNEALAGWQDGQQRQITASEIADLAAARAGSSSTYQIRLAQPGNENKTVGDFIASLKGNKGDPGKDGSPGAIVSNVAHTPAALAAQAATAGDLWYLTPQGLLGSFVWRTGDFTAQVQSDPLQGIYRPVAAVPVSQGCYVRVWNGTVVRPEWFGAVGDYDPVPNTGTDDSAAFAAAARMLAAGGSIQLDASRRYLIAKPFDLGEHVVIDGGTMKNVMQVDQVACARAGNLYLDPAAANIRVGSFSGFRECVVLRRAIQFAITSAQVAAQFTGTAIILQDGTWDHIFDNVAIGGFLQGMISEFTTGGPEHQCNRTKFLGRVLMDNWNDVRIYNAYDVPLLDGYHGWPFVTYASAAEADGAQLKRGTGLWLCGVNDWSKIQTPFCYGRQIGYRLTDCANVVLVAPGADYPYCAAYDGSIGLLVDGKSQEIVVVSPQMVQHDSGIYVTSTAGADRLACSIVSPQLWENRRNGIAVVNGNVTVSAGGFVRSYYQSANSGGSNGVQVASTAGRVRVCGTHFEGLPAGTALSSPSTSVDLRHDDNVTFSLAAGGMPTVNPYQPTIYAADTLLLDGSNRTFRVGPTSGVTVVNGAVNAAMYEGRIVTLYFETNLQLKDGSTVAAPGAPLQLNGDFQAAPGSVLALLAVQGAFVEISRSSPGA